MVTIMKSPMKANVPGTASCPCWTKTPFDIPTAPAMVKAHEITTQYRKGYFFIGRKGSRQEYGADQSIFCLERIATNHANRPTAEMKLIRKHEGQSILDRWNGIDATAPTFAATINNLIAIHLSHGLFLIAIVPWLPCDLLVGASLNLPRLRGLRCLDC
jgi:hypothetical protein